MSIVVGLEQRVADALAGHMPDGVQSSPVDPAEEKAAATGSVWVDEIKVTSQWRGLGNTGAASHARRSETGTIKLVALCYRQAPTSAEAAADARAVVDGIIVGVEAAVEARIDLGDSSSWARVDEVLKKLWPREGGWTAGATITLALEARP